MSQRSRTWHDWLIKFKSAFDTLADVVTWLGSAAGILVLVYIGFGVFTGQLFKISADRLPTVTHSVDLATAVLLYGLSLAIWLVTLRTTEHATEIGAVAVLAGLGLWFGFPALCKWQMDASNGTGNTAMAAAVKNLVLAGMIITAAVAWPVLEGIWRTIRNAPLKKRIEKDAADAKLRREAPKDAKPTLKPTFLSPCWHLPYCRDYLVAMCPAFKARKRCWKFGGGCFCDNSMIEAMLTGVSKGPKGGQAYMQSEIAARTGVARHRQKRPPCKRCFIYNEHEKLKYDVMHPLAYPIAAGITYYLYEPVIKKFWVWLQNSTGDLWSKLAFTAAPVAHKAAQKAATTLGSVDQTIVPGMEIAGVLFAVLIGLFILMGLLRFCEVWCFKWKI